MNLSIYHKEGKLRYNLCNLKFHSKYNILLNQYESGQPLGTHEYSLGRILKNQKLKLPKDFSTC